MRSIRRKLVLYTLALDPAGLEVKAVLRPPEVAGAALAIGQNGATPGKVARVVRPRLVVGPRRSVRVRPALRSESVIDLDPEIPDGAFELRMSEQKLNRSKVTSLSVDLRRLCPAH